MSEVLVIVAVVAVIAIAAFFIIRGRKRSAAEAADSSAALAQPPSEPAYVGEEKGRVEAMQPGPPEPAAEVAAPQREAATPAAEPSVAGPEPFDEGEGAEAAEPALKAVPSDEELRSRVQTQLEDSERILGELRQVVSHGDGVAEPVPQDTLDIMEEGLQEVRVLAKRKDWSQAKDKGDALHAQLSLMLRSARREKAS